MAMRRSAIVLAGGLSKRFGRNKAFVKLRGKPLIGYVIERVMKVSDEVIIVIRPSDDAEAFHRISSDVRVVVDGEDFQSPLVGASAGFEASSGDYSLLVPCDTPFISVEAVRLLFEVCFNVDAVIPRWPNGYIEPLQSVYRTEAALEAARTSLLNGRRDLHSMISLLGRIRYMSTLVIREIDPSLLTFFNVNTGLDLRRAERLFEDGRVERGMGRV